MEGEKQKVTTSQETIPGYSSIGELQPLSHSYHQQWLLTPFLLIYVLSMGWLPCCITVSPLELIGKFFLFSQYSLRITIHKVYDTYSKWVG